MSKPLQAPIDDHASALVRIVELTAQNNNLQAVIKIRERQRNEVKLALSALVEQVKALTLSGGINVYHRDYTMLAIRMVEAQQLLK